MERSRGRQRDRSVRASDSGLYGGGESGQRLPHIQYTYTVFFLPFSFLITCSLAGYIPLWSIEMSEGNITGAFYTNTAVARSLGVTPAHLPLLASLVGNDYTQLSLRELPALHTRMGVTTAGRSGEIIATVSKYLKQVCLLRSVGLYLKIFCAV